MVKYC